MDSIEKQVSGGRYNILKQIFIAVAVLQGFLIVYYSYDLSSYISFTSSKNQSTSIGLTLKLVQTKGYAKINRLFRTVDIHREDSDLGHVYEGASDHMHPTNIVPNSIAVGLGVISKNTNSSNKQTILETFQFFKTFLPSFCKTVSNGYKYNFFLAYDKNDKYFTKEGSLAEFQDIAYDIIHTTCTKGSQYYIHFIQCTHNGVPARAQNDAMIEAYMSNMEYYYRINDDTLMESPKWTETFIEKLKSYKPPYIGVVGPNHRGGNTAVLTYDFVHYTHIEIFGFYYPRLFTGWWADDWITKVYRPDRSTKIPNIRILHTMRAGTRYHVDTSKGKLLGKALENGGKILKRYIAAKQRDPKIKPSGDKVIAMSLSGENPKYTYGAIRNAQLLPVYFPEWKLRIYIPPENSAEKVPVRVINKLRLLNTQVIIVPSDIAELSTDIWKYLVIDDKTVKHFYIRNANNRFNEKDQLLINQFLKEDGSCLAIKDMQSHVNTTFVDGLLAGKNPAFRDSVGKSVKEILLDNKPNMNTFLSKFLWPNLKKHTLFYDTVSKSVTGKVINLKGKTTDINIPLGSNYDEFDQNL